MGGGKGACTSVYDLTEQNVFRKTVEGMRAEDINTNSLSRLPMTVGKDGG
jgi:hypothetical protein